MRYSAWLNTIFQIVAYYFAWFASVMFAAQQNNVAATSITSIIIALQIAWQIYRKDTQHLFAFVIGLAVLGTLVDTFFLKLNFLYFNGNPFSNCSPPWMMGIWICFAIVLFSTFKHFMRRYIIIGALSLILFPLSYYFGIKLGAATLPAGLQPLAYLGLIWAWLFPGYFLLFSNKHDF